jgi:hypothetical protein
MAKRPVTVGPWPRGINLKDDSQLIQDNQLVDALNVVIQTDGSVTNRPGMQAISATDIGTTITQGLERFDVLGIVGDNTFLVGKSALNPSWITWETQKIYKGKLSTDLNSQSIIWTDTGFTPAVALGAEKLAATDAGFETSLGTWPTSGTGCTIALDTTSSNARTGNNSLKMTLTATGASLNNPTNYPVTAGLEYTVSGYAKTVTRSCIIFIRLSFYDSGGTQISSIGNLANITAPINTYTNINGRGVAPVGAVNARITIGVSTGSGALSGDIIYWDDFSIKQGCSGYYVKAITYLDDTYLIPNSRSNTMLKTNNSSFSSMTPITVPEGLDYNPQNYFKAPSVDLCFVWKDRLFICFQDTVYYSKATDFTNWSTAPGLGGFFIVGNDSSGNSDGNYISSTIVVGDALYIFKTKGLYAFTFQTDPGTDGYLKVVSSAQGTTSAVEWKGRIFTCNTNSVYEYVSGQFIDIGRQLNILNGSSGYNTVTGSGYIISTLHVMNDYLVVGPLIKDTASISGRYYAMNLNNGAWSKWDVYKGALHLVDAGDTDTVTCQGPMHNIVGPQHGMYYLGSSELGTQVIFMNYREAANKVADGLSSAQRLPRYYFETKMFTFNNEVQFKKVYRVQFNRNLGISDGGISTTFAKGGFGVRYVKPADLQVSSTTATRIQSLLTDHFGNLKAGSTFRCLSFSMFYEYYYVNQQSITIDDTVRSYRFRINSMIAYVDLKADFANVQTLAVT